MSFASSYWIRRYSGQLVSSSLPPCHWWFYRYLTLFFSHFFFFALKTFIGCLSIPFAIVVLSSFHFLLYPFRLEDTVKYSRCRHTINLHIIQSLFFRCVLCFQFSCPFLVISSTLLFWLQWKTESILIGTVCYNPDHLLSVSSELTILYNMPCFILVHFYLHQVLSAILSGHWCLIKSFCQISVCLCFYLHG